MTMRRDHGLDQEERELAAQLARIAPRGEPSAALDARILAMAQRGAGVEATLGPRRRQRWPAWLAVAASLTAVAGLVWRLEPILHPAPGVRYEAPASVAADTDPNGQRQPIEYIGQDAAAVATAPAPPPPPPPMSDTGPQTAPAATPAATVRARQVAAKATAAADVSAEVAAPAPAPVEPVAANARAVNADRDIAQEVPRRPTPATIEPAATPAAVAGAPVPVPQPAPTAARASRAAAESRNTQALSVEGASVAMPVPPPDKDRAGFDASPPVTADTPEVQKAWLTRIRELRDDGKPDEARTSLKAFIERHPKAEVPADLKPLLPPAPTTSTPKP